MIRWNGVLASSPTLEVVEAGTYVVECEWMGGLFLWTDTVTWEIPATHGLTVEWTEPDCHGEPGLLGWLADGDLEVEHAGMLWDTLVTNVASSAGDAVFITTSVETGARNPMSFPCPNLRRCRCSWTTPPHCATMMWRPLWSKGLAGRRDTW